MTVSAVVVSHGHATELARSLPAELRSQSPVVFVNIGGISNVTFVPEAGEDPVAFDSGPGNALNPGTTADLVTATLFVALVEGML